MNRKSLIVLLSLPCSSRTCCTTAWPCCAVQIVATNRAYRYFLALGAVGDFSDDLLVFAYRRQITSNPKQSHYYLQALKAISQDRASTTLALEVATEQSTGKLTSSDITTAYKYFDLNPLDPQLEDKVILGRFHARVSDSPYQATEARDHLKAIALSRGGKEIQNAIDSFEQRRLHLPFHVS